MARETPRAFVEATWRKAFLSVDRRVRVLSLGEYFRRVYRASIAANYHGAIFKVEPTSRRCAAGRQIGTWK